MHIVSCIDSLLFIFSTCDKEAGYETNMYMSCINHLDLTIISCSDTGSYPPESCVFSFVLSCGAIVGTCAK